MIFQLERDEDQLVREKDFFVPDSDFQVISHKNIGEFSHTEGFSMLKLSKNLRSLIAKNELTVASLARRAQVPKTNITGWLDGASPNIVQLSKVANVLGVTIESLAFGEVINTSKPKDFFEKIDIAPGRYEVLIRRISSKGDQ